MPDTKKAGGDAPPPPPPPTTTKSKGKVVKEVIPEVEEIPKTHSQILKEEAEYRALMRKQRFKRKWPEISKVKVKTRPWCPPPPPQKPPQIFIDLPEIKTRQWVPPYRRRRRRRPKLRRIPLEELTQPMYECASLKKVWHNFCQVEKNKMILQGTHGCNSKKYSSTACGSQTGCIALVCRALLDEKDPSQLVRRDVDDIIESGDRFYKQCMVTMKCYKGKPQLQLNQLLNSFFYHDTKYTVKMVETDKGVLAKHPDSVQGDQDLMTLMEKRIGTTFMTILTVGDRHFLVWGHPPAPESGSAVKTVCYIFDPHILNEYGQPHKVFGAGAFIRYAGINSFVVDFLANYGNLSSSKKGTPKPPIALTDIEVVQKENLIRIPTWDLDMKALKIHCRSEWDTMNINALREKKLKEGQYPLCSLSAVSLASSRATSRRKVKEFYQKSPPKEPPPQLPVAPEKAPPGPTTDQIMQNRGENFFLYCPTVDGHNYGRDDMIPRPKSETILHSPVEIADKNFHSQFNQVDVEKWILRATRHMASYRYQIFKTYTAIACCVAAFGMLTRLRARAWNEDILDETLDLGYNYFRESLVERGGPIRRLVLGELKETFKIRDRDYKQKLRGIAVWGKIISNNNKIMDLCRGIETFFKEADTGVLQIPGEYETAIWNEGGKFYVYHPWPADRYGHKLGLQGGGKACLLSFSRISRLCEHFMENVHDLKRKPFSISDVKVIEMDEMPEPINKMKPIAPNRWLVRGRFNEGDARFPEEHRNKQATPTAITAIAMAHIIDPSTWTPDDIDETLIRGDILYQNTMEHLEKMGISIDTPSAEEEAGEEEMPAPKGSLAAVDVLNRFKISEYDCIETDIMDNAYSGKLNPEPGSGVASLKESLANLFKEYTHAVVTARGGSTAIWRHENHLYFFDPQGCDENGLPSDEPRAASCLVRVKGGIGELVKVIEGNLPSGADDSFNISPVEVTTSKLNADLGAPETKLDSKAFEWISKGTAAIMMGPRGENTAIGKLAEKVGVGEDDMAGRGFALPAAAAFTAATDTVPPPHMHQDHMYNFLDAGAEYYLNHLKKTNRKDIQPEDLKEKFEMGANTFSIELGEPIKLPLRLPDEATGEGGEEGEKEVGEEAEEEKEPPMKQMKDLLFKMWHDQTKPTTVSLLVGDYHQMGVWMAAGGKVVVFDPAPTLVKGLLTPQRIKKGDELRLQRIKDEMSGEGGGDEPEEAGEEAGAEGEERPEPEPDFVPPESCPALMVFASPGEFIDKIVKQGGLDIKQCLAPYKLYPVKVINELTSVLKEKKGSPPKSGEEGGDEEVEEEALIEALDDAAFGPRFMRLGRAVASLRARVAQNENFFMDTPNRDNQDAANAVMGIVVDHIEPYVHWSPQLLDAVLKYGDRLYSLSLPRATCPPTLTPREVAPEFHVTSFNVKLDIEGDVVNGDIKAGSSGGVLNLKRGLTKFFESNKYGVVCAKGYCVGIWRGADDKAYCLWEPHAVGPTGKSSPGGAAALVLFSTVDELANTLLSNIENLARPGTNKFSIASVKVFWEISKSSAPVTAQGQVPDEGYEWKVLTAFVEIARGRTILRGSRPPDIYKFTRDAVLQSACGAIVSACMTNVRRPPLWTRKTVDEIMSVSSQLFAASIGSLGYEFRPGEDVLLPLQVLKRFILGVNYVGYDLDSAFTGKLEQVQPTEMSLRAALVRFFESNTHGILWSMPYAVAVWKVSGSPSYYMFEPHACGPTGLRIDAEDDGAACVLTFSSPKLMAFNYLQNIPLVERPRREFYLYSMSVNVRPITKLGRIDPPLVRAPPGVTLMPATSKVTMTGVPRRADESDRKHPPGSATCLDAIRASEARDKEQTQLSGQRNTSGWLSLIDRTQYLSAAHSMACKKFPHGSRGRQAVPCAVMAVAMSRVEDVCRWCSSTLDQILESGDQLYQDSYLHFKPTSKILNIQQVLRKFYTPGNCVCRVVVYQPRHKGVVDADLQQQLTEFFREEKTGVLVAGDGDFAVALFKTPRGLYMWDPADRDRYARAVAPPCAGRARACLSRYPNVNSLCEKLGANIPPVIQQKADDEEPASPKPKEPEKFDNESEQKSVATVKEESNKVHFEEPATFAIYGMEVTSLRRINKHEL